MRIRTTLILLVAAIPVTLSVTTVAASRKKPPKYPPARRAIAPNPNIGRYFPKSTPGRRQLLADMRAAALKEQTEFRGVSVKPHPRATGDTLKLHQRISSLLENVNFVPPQRASRFNWIVENDVVHLVGWDASIETITTVRGGVQVTLKVHPRAGGTIQFADHVFETYFFDGKNISFVGIEVGVFPVAMARYAICIQ